MVDRRLGVAVLCLASGCATLSPAAQKIRISNKAETANCAFLSVVYGGGITPQSDALENAAKLNATHIVVLYDQDGKFTADALDCNRTRVAQSAVAEPAVQAHPPGSAAELSDLLARARRSPQDRQLLSRLGDAIALRADAIQDSSLKASIKGRAVSSAVTGNLDGLESCLVDLVRALNTSSAGQGREAASPGKPKVRPDWVVAVMEVEDRAPPGKGGLPPTLIRNLGDQLRVFMAEKGLRTIDRGQQENILKDQISKAKKESYDSCYASECQIELGKALAASHILRSEITHFGKSCVLNAELIDLKAEVTIAAASSRGSCEEEGFLEMSENVVATLSSAPPPGRDQDRR